MVLKPLVRVSECKSTTNFHYGKEHYEKIYTFSLKVIFVKSFRCVLIGGMDKKGVFCDFFSWRVNKVRVNEKVWLEGNERASRITSITGIILYEWHVSRNQEVVIPHGSCTLFSELCTLKSTYREYLLTAWALAVLFCLTQRREVFFCIPPWRWSHYKALLLS